MFSATSVTTKQKQGVSVNVNVSVPRMVSAPRLEENNVAANMSTAIVENDFVTTIQVSKMRL